MYKGRSNRAWKKIFAEEATRIGTFSNHIVSAKADWYRFGIADMINNLDRGLMINNPYTIKHKTGNCFPMHN